MTTPRSTQLHLEEVLKRLGWTDGFQIPVASAENKALEEEVARLTLQRIRAKTSYENAEGRYNALQEHLKFVNQESDQTQKLITAHTQQLDNGTHELSLTKMQRDRIQTELRQATKNIEEIGERNELTKGGIKKGLCKLETLKNESTWDSEALKAWEESLKKRDEDNEMLKKFSREDEKKFTELDVIRHNLQLEFDERKKVVSKMVSDLTNLERILERTGKTIKKQVTERDAMIKQWKDSVNIMYQRDIDIDKAQTQLYEANRLIEEAEESLRQEEKFLKNQEVNNKDLEREIEELNNLNSIAQRQYNDICQYILLLSSELNVQKRLVSSTAARLETERKKNKQTARAIKLKEKAVEDFAKIISDLEEKLQTIKDMNFNAAEKVKHIEKLIEFELRQQKMLSSDMDKIQVVIFKSQELLKEETNLGKIKQLEITNNMYHIANLRKTNRDLLTKVEVNKEQIYNMEFAIDQLEEKLLKLESEKSTFDNSDELTNQIRALEKQMTELGETTNMLHDQITRIQDEMRRLTTAISSDDYKIEFLKNKLVDQNLNYEGGLKQVAEAKNRTQRQQVEENILMLRHLEYEKCMKREANDIYNLQKIRINLEQAMRERELEIKAKKDIIHSQRRTLDEERGRIKADINTRLIKIRQIQQKYHIILMTMGKDDDGQVLSVTHFKIKAAQEKYMLQEEGDKLDAKIKTIENEIIGMENTLKVVNIANNKYKISLGAVEEQGKEMNEMHELENQYSSTGQFLRKCKKELVEKKRELDELKNEIKTLDESKEEFRGSLVNLEADLEHIKAEADKKREQLKRTETLIKQTLRKIKKHQIERYDKDIEIRQLQDTNKTSMFRLLELCENAPEVNPTLSRYAEQYNLQFPPKRSLYLSSSSESSVQSIKSGTLLSQDKSSSSRSSKSSSSSGQSASLVSNIHLNFDG